MSANDKARSRTGGNQFNNTIAPKSTEQAMLIKQDELIVSINSIVAIIKTIDTSTKINSGAGSGGNATEAMTVTGLLATDEIVAVTQKTKGANSLPLLGWSTQANDALTGIWSADPGAGAVIQVQFKRARVVSNADIIAVLLKGG